MKCDPLTSKFLSSITLVVFVAVGCNQFQTASPAMGTGPSASGVAALSPARPRLSIFDNQSSYNFELQNHAKWSAQTVSFSESAENERDEPFVAIVLSTEDSKIFTDVSVSDLETGVVLSDVNCAQKMNEMSAKFCQLSLSNLIVRKNCGFSLSQSYHSLKKGKYRLSLSAIDQTVQNIEFEIEDSCGDSAVATQHREPATPAVRAIASATDSSTKTAILDQTGESPFRWAWSAIAIILILLSVATLDFRKSKSKH